MDVPELGLFIQRSWAGQPHLVARSSMKLLGQVPKKLVSRPARAGKDQIITDPIGYETGWTIARSLGEVGTTSSSSDRGLVNRTLAWPGHRGILGQLQKKLAAGPRVLARTKSLRTQSGTKQGGPPHDHWAKLGQLRYTRSLYAFVVIALF